jgi:uncharacterized damage-inducible protein DinB
MSTSTLLTELLQYKAWANEELLASLVALDEMKYAAERRTAILLIDHAYTVDRIFVANLQRQRHAYTATESAEPPALEELCEQVKQTDRWYVDYVKSLSSAELAENIEFTFAESGTGRMSREEMLAHVITHGGYHRGEVGQILSRLSIPRPRDIFTAYLHKFDPTRRDCKVT